MLKPSFDDRTARIFRHRMAFLVGLSLFSFPAWAAPKTQDSVILVMPSQRGLFLDKGAMKRNGPGLDCVALAVETERKRDLPSLLVSGGDMVSFPFSRSLSDKDGWDKRKGRIQDSQRLKDRTEWWLINALKLDAMTPGFLELRHDAGWLQDMQKACPSMHIVSANVADSSGTLLFPPYAIIARGGVRFGVTGISSAPKPPPEKEPHRSDKSDSTAVRAMTRFETRMTSLGADIHIEDPGEPLSRAVVELRAKCDVVVVLFSTQKSDAEALIRRMRGIDVAVVSYVKSGTGRMENTTLVPRGGGTDTFAKIVVRGRHGTKGVTVAQMPVPPDSGRADIDDHLTAWANLGRVERELESKWTRGSEHDEIDFPAQLDSLEAGPNGETSVYVTLPKGKHGRLQWPGPTELQERPLSDELTHPRDTRRLSIAEDGHGQDALVGSVAETKAMELIRFLSVSQEFAPRIEELVSTLEDRPKRELPWAEWAKTLDSLYGVLSFQRASVISGDQPYWRRRAVVFASVTLDTNGAVSQVSVVENNDWPTAAESIKRLEMSRNVSEGNHILIGMAMDRREARLESALDTLKARWGKKGSRPSDELLPEDAAKWKGSRLPKEARKTLDSKELSSVVAIWRKADPEFSWDDFISTPSDTLWATANGLSRDDGSKALRKLNSKAGLLWVGWSTVEHPRLANGMWANLQVPTVWLQKTREPYLIRYQGALTPQINAPDVRHALEATLTSPSPH